ncbi:MAG: hypothetical protein UR12_C0034G0004, partial [candidate division TM6 bacterium GW2011_GWF2_30_66]
MLKYTKFVFIYIIIILAITPQELSCRIKGKTFSNIVAQGNILANTVNINTNLTVNRNIVSYGDITSSSNIIASGDITSHSNINAKNVYVNGTISASGGIVFPSLQAGVVHSSATGALSSSQVTNSDIETATSTSTPNSVMVRDNSSNVAVNLVELNGIIKDGNTTLWPTGPAITGNYLMVSATPGQLTYGTPAGGGNVSTVGFTDANNIVKTSAAGTNVVESNIKIDASENITGIASLGATTLNSTNANITNLSATNIGSTTMTGDIAMGEHNISSAGTISAITVSPTNLSGTTMTGNLTMGSNNITGIGTVNASTVNAGTANINTINSTGINMYGDIQMGTKSITGANTITAGTITATAAINTPTLNLSGPLNMGGNNITGVGTINAGTIIASNMTGTTITGNINMSGNNITGINLLGANTITANLIGNISGTATNFSGTLSGDVIGTQNATVVKTIGITPATGANSIESGAIAANFATNANTPNLIVLRDGSGGFSADTITATQFSGPLSGTVTGNLIGNADTATTSVSFSGPVGTSGGDITGLQGNLTVNTVGGRTAAYIATGAQLAYNSTKDNTFDAIVRRGSAGEFSAGTITANLIGNVTGALYGNADTATTAGHASNATGFSGPLSGDVTGTQSATVVSYVGGKTSTQIAQATDLALSATSNNLAETIVKRNSLGNLTANMITLNTSAILNPNDVTTKSYVDTAVAMGIVPKEPALVVSTISTSTFGLGTIDGVSLSDGNRVLLTGQTDGIENGLWLAHAGDWTRPTDFANGSEAMGAYVLILSGATNAGTSWLCDTPATIVGTDDVNFVQFSLPDSTQAANVGSGTGQIYKDKTGVTLNFKTLAALGNIVLTNNTSDVSINTDATPNNTASTIIARDANGYFTASGMTGAASDNVLKAGDTMTGNLLMSNQSAIRLVDSGSNYVGLRSPATIGTSYTIDLPDTAPTANQVLQAISATGTTWTALSPAPSATQN